MDVRPPAVAGSFYPADPATLRGAVDRLLAGVDVRSGAAPNPPPAPKALIVPHAGYVYSGPIAAAAYARLRGVATAIRRVILVGPAHRVLLRGLALPGARQFATPLGVVAVDAEAAAIARRLPHVVESPLAHAEEHSLEVQLPFLQRVLPDFTLLPLVVGDATGAMVAAVLDALWGGPETLLVISSDLSHYHPYGEAQALDRTTAGRILAFAPDLDHEQACGATPVNGLLLAARRRGMQAELLDLRNSGDTAGDRGRVVGYAAFGFRDGGTDAAH
jgi:AmmeMemoRadiSam system protein B